MSAPTTHDPLVVNTKDGTTWSRRAVTQDGHGLYAVTDSCKCPEYLMATLSELAERGIVGSAYALPMPVGPEPLALSEEQIEALVAAGDRVVNDAVHRDLCMCDAWPEKCVSTGHYFMGAWDVDGLEAALPAVLGLWEQMRGGELETLKARVAELEALRADRASGDGCSCPPADHPHQVGCPLDLPAPGSSERPVNELTAVFMPVPSLRASLEDPHDGPLAHPYRLGHDLPETGGA